MRPQLNCVLYNDRSPAHQSFLKSDWCRARYLIFDVRFNKERDKGRYQFTGRWQIISIKEKLSKSACKDD